MLFISLSLVVAWFLSAPISVFTTLEDTKLLFHSVDKKLQDGIESFEYDGCKEGLNCKCVALVHGLGDSAYTWTKTLTSSSKTWETDVYFYAVNLPGSSNSLALSKTEDYHINKMADLLIQHLPSRCDKWNLVGNSFGGWISIKAAARHPNKVEGLLLLGTAGVESDYKDIIETFKAPNPSVLQDFQKRAYANPKYVPDFVFQHLAKRLKAMPVNDMIHAQTEDSFINNDFKKLKMPTYLLWGDKDQVCPLDFAHTLKSLNTEAKLEVVNDCGHLPQKECFDDFVKSLNSLLKETSPTPQETAVYAK